MDDLFEATVPVNVQESDEVHVAKSKLETFVKSWKISSNSIMRIMRNYKSVLKPTRPLRPTVESNVANLHAGILLGHAVEDERNGKRRKVADSLKSIYLKYPNGFANVHCLVTYGECFLDKRKKLSANESDVNFLKEAERNTKSMMMNRIEAAYLLGCIYWSKGIDKASAQRLRRAIQYETEMSETERDQMINIDAEMVKLSDFLKMRMQMVWENLTNLERILERKSDTPAEIRAMNRVPNVATVVFPDRLVPREMVRVIHRRASAIRGGECDHCTGKPVNPSNTLVDLKRCSRCWMAYYCSTKCQKEAWKAGHKRYYRAPCDLKPGDIVKLKDVEFVRVVDASTDDVLDFKAGKILKVGDDEYPTVNGFVMEVVGSLDAADESREKETWWKIDFIGGGGTMAVRGFQMTMVIPEELRKVAKSAEYSLKMPGSSNKVLHYYTLAKANIPNLKLGHSGKRSKLGLGACLLIVIREDKLPITIEEVAKFIACDDILLLQRMYTKLRTGLHLQQQEIHQSRQFINKACIPLTERLTGDEDDAYSREDLIEETERIFVIAETKQLGEARKCLPLTAAVVVMAHESLTGLRAEAKIFEEVSNALGCKLRATKQRHSELIHILADFINSSMPWFSDRVKGKARLGGKELYRRLREVIDSTLTILGKQL
ncbi:hypothetical protein HDU76_012390 [Blyttiomyces sp. JEL0837]|nr:hypothetical protein HDU76_012390 [Blyttiomyces sp. JEL0837]